MLYCCYNTIVECVNNMAEPMFAYMTLQHSVVYHTVVCYIGEYHMPLHHSMLYYAGLGYIMLYYTIYIL